jgi:hypothetical protein
MPRPEKTVNDMSRAHAQGFAEERKAYVHPGAEVADRKDAFVAATIAVMETADRVLAAARNGNRRIATANDRIIARLNASDVSRPAWWVRRVDQRRFDLARQGLDSESVRGRSQSRRPRRKLVGIGRESERSRNEIAKLQEAVFRLIGKVEEIERRLADRFAELDKRIAEIDKRIDLKVELAVGNAMKKSRPAKPASTKSSKRKSPVQTTS